MSTVTSNTTVSQAEYDLLKAKLAALEAQVAAKNNRELYFRIGEDKGAIGIYGLSAQFPISLYVEQVPKFFKATTGADLPADSPLGKFIAQWDELLSRKGDDDATAKARKVARMAKVDGDVVAHPKNNKATT